MNVFTPQMLENLAKIGFVASESGLHEKAEQIFLHLIRARPSNPAPAIGLCMVYARDGRVILAIEQLRQLVNKFPDSDMAKAVLGVLLTHNYQRGAAILFDAVLQSNKDPAAVRLAKTCLSEAQKIEQKFSGHTAIVDHVPTQTNSEPNQKSRH